MKPFNEFELYSVLLFIVLKIHLTQVERFYPSEVVCEKKTFSHQHMNYLCGEIPRINYSSST